MSANDMGIKVSRRTLQRYCDYMGLPKDPGRTDISEWYMPGLSVQQNLQYAKVHGIKVGKTSLYDYCKKNGIPTKGTGD